MIEIRRDTHTVIKNDDIDKYLAQKDANVLKALIERLRVSKACNSLSQKENSYYIVNTDEPYVEEVLQVILNREKENIQSEPKDKTNFDVITESPDKLKKFINLVANARTVICPYSGAIAFLDEGIVEYLNQKADDIDAVLSRW